MKVAGRQGQKRRGVGGLGVRGLPNCAVSLSAIDRLASAINTGHRALATPGTHPHPATHAPPSPPSVLHPPRPPTLVRLQRATPLAPLAPLAVHVILFPRAAQRAGRETLTFKRATEGEGGGHHLPVTHLPPRPPAPPTPLCRVAIHSLFLAPSSSRGF